MDSLDYSKCKNWKIWAIWDSTDWDMWKKGVLLNAAKLGRVQYRWSPSCLWQFLIVAAVAFDRSLGFLS
jgi:hypothetical protein